MREWLRTRLQRFLFPPDNSGKVLASVRENHTPDVEGMRFTVMPAEGGTIVQLRTYDNRKDESHMKTYVIPDAEQDIAHRVGQIVAMELFRV